MGGDHGDHGHDHEVPVPIPDWRKYRVEDVPQLLQVQKALASKGLKDPWLRNEVWRYDPGFGGSENVRLRAFFFRGFKWGLAAFVATVALEKIFGAHDNHHHEHQHH